MLRRRRAGRGLARRGAARAGAGTVHHRRLHHLDAGFRAVRLSAADLQGEDRHRRAGDRARHRSGARHRPARRRRRGVRARPLGGDEIPGRRFLHEALSGDVQRLRHGRAEERPGEDQGQEGRGKAIKAIATAQAPFVSRGDRSGTNIAELQLWKDAGIDIAADRGPWYRESARAWARRSTPPAPWAPTCCPTAAPGSPSRTRAICRSLVEGDKRLFNQYGVMLVNPAKFPNVKTEHGQQFID